jgi:hypothetical protein
LLLAVIPVSRIGPLINKQLFEQVMMFENRPQQPFFSFAPFIDNFPAILLLPTEYRAE